MGSVDLQRTERACETESEVDFNSQLDMYTQEVRPGSDRRTRHRTGIPLNRVQPANLSYPRGRVIPIQNEVVI